MLIDLSTLHTLKDKKDYLSKNLLNKFALPETNATFQINIGLLKRKKYSQINKMLDKEIIMEQ